ncbi:MAG: type I-A CRISPR-associated protein Cas5a [Sulfolobus sp.]|jgi:CRISPR-associated protein Cas5a/b/c
MKPLSILTTFTASWGFSVKDLGTTAYQPSFILPPPTTAIGALTSGVARALGKLYEDNKLLDVINKATLYAGFSVEGAIAQHVDISRYIIRVYMRPTNRKLPQYQFGAVPVGKTYVYGRLKMLVALDPSKLTLEVRQVLSKAPYYITRIGMKEGIVAVDEVKVGEAEEREVFDSSFYQRVDCVEVVGEGFLTVSYWKGGFIKEAEERAAYIIPGIKGGYFTSTRLKFKAKKKGYVFEGEGFATCE